MTELTAKESFVKRFKEASNPPKELVFKFEVGDKVYFDLGESLFEGCGRNTSGTCTIRDRQHTLEPWGWRNRYHLGYPIDWMDEDDLIRTPKGW